MATNTDKPPKQSEQLEELDPQTKWRKITLCIPLFLLLVILIRLPYATYKSFVVIIDKLFH